jgi:acyl-coenzyme A thioesterase PaaI-like protein
MKKELASALIFLDNKIPGPWKETALLQAFGLFKVPLLFSVRPRVASLSDKKCEVKIPLSRFTKNHLGSMYFGALAIGADCVVGLLALHLAKKKGGSVILAFKDFHADFIRRPENDVTFVCDEGAAISKLVDQVLKTGERANLPVKAHAMVKGEKDPVATFTLTLSLKKKA